MLVKERVAILRQILWQQKQEQEKDTDLEPTNMDWSKFSETPFFPNFSKWSKLS